MIFYVKKDSSSEEELSHHGILGQKWGSRNGPPYPLKGGDYSAREVNKIFVQRKKKNSIYNKKHFDNVISEKDVLSTLSYDKDRTKNVDMFYAAYKPLDKHQYNALFNKPIQKPIYDENGDEIGTGTYLKYRINNKVKHDMKVASEDAASKAFTNLYSNDRDFYNYVTDASRMQQAFVSDKYKFKGYREARKELENIRSGKIPSNDDLQKVYRMFNYTIPYDGSGNKRAGDDTAKQRAKFFKELKSQGYGAVLDTNDAIYGGFKATAPVIVFDMDAIIPSSVKQTTISSKAISNVAFIGRKFLGI
jgi:hypothetical protein